VISTIIDSYFQDKTRTKPQQTASVLLFPIAVSAQLYKCGSGTSTTPVFGSIVQLGIDLQGYFYEFEMRHRGFAQRWQIHPVQRPDQSGHCG
jgi:hypothetical protein